MINCENLKMLLNTNEDTLSIYKILNAVIDKNSKDLLYICQTKEEAEFNYNKLVEKNKYYISKKDKQNRIIEFKNKDTIYVWTINKVKRKIHGYKFRDVRIR